MQARARRSRTEVREVWIGRGCPCHLPTAGTSLGSQCIRRGRTVSPSRKGRASTVGPGAMQRGTVTGVSESAPNPGLLRKARRASARTRELFNDNQNQNRNPSLPPFGPFRLLVLLFTPPHPVSRPPNYYTLHTTLAARPDFYHPPYTYEYARYYYRYTMRGTIHALTRLFDISIGLSSSPLRAHLRGRPSPNLSRLLSVAPFFPPRSSTPALLL